MPTNSTSSSCPNLPTGDDLNLALRMKHHDWFFMMSDDPTVFRGGERASERLMRDLRKISQDEALALWEAHAPKTLPNPFKEAG